MENKLTKVRTVTTVTGTIDGQNVTINYDNLEGEKPQSITASCTIPATATGEQPSYLNITLQTNGQESVNINGTIDIADLAVLVEAIKVELKTI